MRKRWTPATIVAASLSLAAAPAAFAQTSHTGNSAGTPNMNICLAQIDCTYVNHQHGKPTDVVRHTGTLVDFSLNAGSVGGQVRLRILRPGMHGRYKAIRSSAVKTVTNPGINTFTTRLKVRRGDVLGLSNATSGIYMTTTPAGPSVRYFMGSLNDGATFKPTNVSPHLHMLLSADIHS